jgi:hypothetical protein
VLYDGRGEAFTSLAARGAAQEDPER